MSPGSVAGPRGRRSPRRALAASKADDCIVIVEDRFDADVRFAINTTTTNGVRRDRQRHGRHVVDERLAVGRVGVASRFGSGRRR